MTTPSTVPPTLARLETLGDLFTWRVATTPDTEAYREFSAASGQWVSTSWAQISERVARWRSALLAMQLAPASRIAILLPNGVDAVCIDQASLSLGYMPVPMHAIDNPQSIAYIVEDSDAAVLVLAGQAQWQAICATDVAMSKLQCVVLCADDGTPVAPDARAVPVITLEKWLAQGSAQGSGQTRPPAPSADTLAAIVYTSGTTGKPKGVMLSHRNVMSNVKAVLTLVAVGADDVFLSFLPLSHTFERTIGYYLAVATGSCVAYVRSVALIADDLKIVKPTVLVSVPRIYERFYAKLQETLEAKSPLVRAAFRLAEQVGWRQFCRQQGLPFEAHGPALFDSLLAPLLQRAVGRQILDQFGGRLRFAVCGGAAMSQSVAQCFLGLGLPLMQGYGMTETSPVVACNTMDDNWPVTVGHVLPGVEVRIGENNELQVRGECVMQGYWKRPEDTAAAMTNDGWLRTGDQASYVDGRVRITGRIKEIIVTSTGEKIPPNDLELAIGADTLFDQVYVYGENRPFIAAFVVLNPQGWEHLAGELGVDPKAPASLDDEKVRATVLARIKQAAASFPYYAVPRAVRVKREPWAIANGLMTPTLKLKRKALQASFAADIEAIYKK